MISFTYEVKLNIEYFGYFIIFAILFAFSVIYLIYEINGSLMHFVADCQYTLKFFKLIFLKSLSSMFYYADLSTNEGCH